VLDSRPMSLTQRALLGGAIGLVASLAAAIALASPSPTRAAPAAIDTAPADTATAAPASPAASDTTADLRPPDGLPIRSVVIRTREVFDPVPGGALRPLYKIVNAIHVKTRPSTIRRQLLFKPGDPWSEARAKETERNLRALYFVDPQPISATRHGDSVDVLVDTRDNWTTEPSFELAGGGGKTVGSVILLERNLLGLGKLVELSYRETRTKIERSVRYQDPGFAGTHARLDLSAGNETSGGSASAFYAEDTPWSYLVSFDRSESRTHLFDQDIEVERFDRNVHEGSASVGHGSRVDGTILRINGTFLYRDRLFGVSEPLTPAGPLVGGDVEELRNRRLDGEIFVWRPKHVVRRQVEHLDGVEDFDLGYLGRVKVGWSPHALGSTQDEGYGEAELRLGALAGGAGFGWVDANLSSRMRRQPLETLLQVEARWVNQSLPRQTWVLGVNGTAGSRMPRDFQVLMGSLDGLRGYPEYALAGHRSWRVNVEDRIAGPREVLRLVSLGAAVFYDGAAAFGPGSNGNIWLHDVGAGLRISFPRSSHKRVGRMDVAWPLRTTNSLRPGATLTFGAEQAF
jgi:hypothetical protein